MDRGQQSKLASLTVVFFATIIYNFVVYVLGSSGNFHVDFFLGVPVHANATNQIVLKSNVPVYLVLGFQAIVAGLAYIMVPYTPCYVKHCPEPISLWKCTPWGFAQRYLSQLMLGVASGLTALSQLIVSGEMSFLILLFCFAGQVYVVIITTRYIDPRYASSRGIKRTVVNAILTSALISTTAACMIWNISLNNNECKTGTTAWWIASALFVNLLAYIPRISMYTYLWCVFWHLFVTNIVVTSLLLSFDCYYPIVDV